MLLAIPVILCCKEEQLSKDFIDAMKPDYDIIHVIHSIDIAQDELPALLSGEAQKPHSGLGSNMHNASIAHSGRHPTPKAVIVTGKFSGADFEKLKHLVGKETVPVLVDGEFEESDVGNAGLRAKGVLQQHGLKPGVEGVVGKGEVWEF